MNLEIERKFLVLNDSFKSCCTRQAYLKQGYLSLDKERTVRVRIADDSAFITIKGISSEKGMSRFEWEKEISVEDAKSLLNLALPGVIEKRRYIVPFDGHEWEIDEFEGGNLGLRIAEIELQSEDETFMLPDFIGEEVTNDHRYYNSYISQHPYSTWSNL